jgi:hypothetical protein
MLFIEIEEKRRYDCQRRGKGSISDILTISNAKKITEKTARMPKRKSMPGENLNLTVSKKFTILPNQYTG